MEKLKISEQLGRPLLWLCLLVLVGIGLGYGLLHVTGEMEILRVNAQARAMEAKAAADQAAAVRANAEAALAPAEAAANTVNRQSWVATWQGFLFPVGLFVFAVVMLALGLAGGLVGGIILTTFAKAAQEEQKKARRKQARSTPTGRA